MLILYMMHFWNALKKLVIRNPFKVMMREVLILKKFQNYFTSKGVTLKISAYTCDNGGKND